MWALIGAAGLVELAGIAGIAATLNGSGRAPGDFAFDGGFAKDATKLERFKLSEIKHSRKPRLTASPLPALSAADPPPMTAAPDSPPVAPAPPQASP